MILGAPNIKENMEEINFKNGTLKATDPCPVAVEKSIDNAAYIANNIEEQQEHSDGEYKKYPCYEGYARKILPMSDAYLYVRSSARSVHVVIFHDILVENRQAFVTQGIVKVVSSRPFMIQMANWSSQQVLIPKRTKIAV